MLGTVESIRKRNGQVVGFDQGKIANAIWAAVQAVGGKDQERSRLLSEEVVKLLRRKYAGGGIPSVEHVQDIVEKVLIENGHAKTAKAYILYREQHKNIREVSRLLRDISIVDDYLEEQDWRVKENSNMTFSLQGLNVHITQKVIANYWLSAIYPQRGARGAPERRVPHPRPGHPRALLRGLGPAGPAAGGFSRGAGQGGVPAPQALRRGPDAGGELPLHPAGRGGRGPGLLQLRYPAGALHRPGRPGLWGGQAGGPEVPVQHERAHPGGLPDPVHQHHPGPAGAGVPEELAGDRGRAGGGTDLRGVPG